MIAVTCMTESSAYAENAAPKRLITTGERGSELPPVWVRYNSLSGIVYVYNDTIRVEPWSDSFIPQRMKLFFIYLKISEVKLYG